MGKGESGEKCAQQLRATAPAPGQGRCEKIQNLTARTTESPVSKFKTFTCVSLSCRRGLAYVLSDSERRYQTAYIPSIRAPHQVQIMLSYSESLEGESARWHPRPSRTRSMPWTKVGWSAKKAGPGEIKTQKWGQQVPERADPRATTRGSRPSAPRRNRGPVPSVPWAVEGPGEVRNNQDARCRARSCPSESSHRSEGDDRNGFRTVTVSRF